MGQKRTPDKTPDFLSPEPSVEDFAYEDRMGSWHDNDSGLYVSRAEIEEQIAPKTAGEEFLRDVGRGIRNPFNANSLSDE